MSRTNPLFVEFSQKVTLRFEEKNRGDGFLRGIHSSMFFRFDWQDLTKKSAQNSLEHIEGFGNGK